MKLALDWDGTYDRDPDFWNAFIDLAKRYGHEVTIVTKRGLSNQTLVSLPGTSVIHTDRAAKLKFVEDRGQHFDIWIDDSPGNLFVDG